MNLSREMVCSSGTGQMTALLSGLQTAHISREFPMWQSLFITTCFKTLTGSRNPKLSEVSQTVPSSYQFPASKSRLQQPEARPPKSYKYPFLKSPFWDTTKSLWRWYSPLLQKICNKLRLPLLEQQVFQLFFGDLAVDKSFLQSLWTWMRKKTWHLFS